ncbi:TVP38/TMEM64 family protein [Marinobacter sp. M216]|uniref:TVP38/TMEM64 family membrane protein n=1 Tax=Marinobacter albus TaxID=3030833 RepID=A0ABT7HG09_9GAMM|nr:MULTISPECIES: TVP38/TMEM64 family protein [unclassified Marinobacter]MBW7471886.1 TVP38/TMEM64 family protein [Marinobacter sp. F4218]MDK9558456.1 TVP38/TMEM64 family protein [Marinobacter sp. M216]
MNRSHWVFRLSFLAIVALVMAATWLVLRQLGMPASLSPAAISDWLNQQGMFGPLLLMLMMILGVVVGPIPTLPISAASGLAFGMVKGTAIAVAGAMIGAMIAFYLARVLGREVVQRKLENNPVFSVNGSQRFLFVAVLITRLIPLFSFALISYAAGVTAIRAWRFALASAIGMLPMTFVFAGLGHSFEFNPLLTVAAAALILVIMSTLPWYLSRRPQSRLSRWLHLSS